MNAPTKITAKQLTGYDRLHNARLNKGTAFTEAERSAFGLEGLLPPAVLSLELQVARRHDEIANLRDDLLKYLVLSDLQARNETLYYAVLMSDPATVHADCVYAYGWRGGVRNSAISSASRAAFICRSARAAASRSFCPIGPKRTCASSS